MSKWEYSFAEPNHWKREDKHWLYRWRWSRWYEPWSWNDPWLTISAILAGLILASPMIAIAILAYLERGK